MATPIERPWYVIVPDARDAKILLRATARGWSLPDVPGSSRPWWREVDRVHASVSSSLALDATVLRCIELREPFETSGLLAFVMEPRQLTWARPPGSDWFGAEDISGLVLEDERQARALERYFTDEALDGPPAWMRRGWMGSAVSWLEGEFERLGVRASGRVQQVRMSSFAQVLRIPLESTHVYLKVCGDGCGQEPEVTAALARESAALVPPVLAVDVKRRFLLTADAGASVEMDRPRAERLLRDLAEIQLQCAERPERLLELGCPDRRPEVLETEVQSFLASLPDHLIPDLGERDARGALERELAHLGPAFVELAQGEVPASLHHPDFRPGRVLERVGASAVTGWSGALAHPFLSPAKLISAFTEPATREQLVDHYLEPWTGFAPRERLRALYARARQVEGIHRAIDALARAGRAQTLSERAAAFEAVGQTLHELRARA